MPNLYIFTSPDLTLDTDEGYALSLNETQDGRITATIKAKNYFGGRHGLETLNQLIIYDDIRSEIQVRNLEIRYENTNKVL